MTLINQPLMYLEFISETHDASIYKITEHDSYGTITGQVIVFYHEDCSVKFIEPLSGIHEYLNKNIKFLRSILFTSARVVNKNNFKIPFTFPAEKKVRDNTDNSLKVYSDGSCNINGIGGWASVILKSDIETIELSGSEINSTSNRMELMAAFMGIEKAAELLPDCGRTGIHLLTDSYYVIKGINHRLEVWSINGFTTAKGAPVANIDIWKKIEKILKQNSVFCEWIKSGGSDENHRRCDILAWKENKNKELHNTSRHIL